MLVVSVEYPSYSIYDGEPSSAKVSADAIYVYDFLTRLFGLSPDCVFVVGRSLGCFVATSLAAARPVRCTALISPFVSLKVGWPHQKASETLLGFVGRVGALMIKDSFNNMANLQRMACPVFILHGLKDDLVPVSHSQELYAAYDHEIDLVVAKEMGHGFINPKQDFLVPFARFLDKLNARNKAEAPRAARILKLPRCLYASAPQPPLLTPSQKAESKSSKASLTN